MGAAADALSRASKTGEGGAVLVLGPPGIGKSALLDALVAEAEGRGFVVGWSKADEGDQIARGPAHRHRPRKSEAGAQRKR